MSGKPIHLNFSAADAATGTVQTLVNAMLGNTENLKAIYAQLLAQFEGSGADGYQAVMSDFNTKLSAYDGKVKELNTSMQHHVNTGGTHHQTDIAQGNRFLSA